MATPSPKPGDVLVSKRFATASYELSTVAGPPQLLISDRAAAIERAAEVAAGLQVDAWYTEDHTHFSPLARHRAARRAESHEPPDRP